MHSAQGSIILRVGAATGVAVAAALALRYLYLDSDSVRVACDARPETFACTLRARLAFILRVPAIGWGILALTLVALVRPAAPLLMLAAMVAGAGMVLYQADLASGSVALLLMGIAMTMRRAGQHQS